MTPLDDRITPPWEGRVGVARRHARCFKVSRKVAASKAGVRGGSGFRVQGEGSGFRVQGSGFRVRGSGVSGELRVESRGLRVADRRGRRGGTPGL